LFAQSIHTFLSPFILPYYGITVISPHFLQTKPLELSFIEKYNFTPNYALGNTKGGEALSILENKPSNQWRFLP